MMDTPHDRRQLFLIHRALCVGCALFLGMMLVLYAVGTVPLSPGLPMELQWLGLGVAAVAVPIAFAVFRSLLVKVSEEFNAETVVQRVRSACIVHWALIESAVFLNLVLFLLSATWANLAVGVLALGVLFMRAPKSEAYQRWMGGTP
jgi:hypothetical protein